MAHYTPITNTTPENPGGPLPTARKTALSTNPRTQFGAYMARAKKNGVLDKDSLTSLARDAYAHQYEIILLLSRFADCSRAAMTLYGQLKAKNHSLSALSSGCCDQSLAARDSLFELNRQAGKGAAKDELSSAEHVELTLDTLGALIRDLDEQSDLTLSQRKSLIEAVSHAYRYISFRNHEFQRHLEVFESSLNTVQYFSEILNSLASPVEWESSLDSFSKEDVAMFSKRLPDEDKIAFKNLGRRTLETLKNNVLSLRGALGILTKYSEHRAERQKHLSQIVECNLLLSARATYKRRPPEDRLFDLCQEANEGLITATDRYSYWLGYAFSTYAMWWINQRLERYRERNTDGVFSVPCSVSARHRSIVKSLADEQSAWPVQKLADELGCPTQKRPGPNAFH